MTDPKVEGVELLVATGRQKPGALAEETGDVVQEAAKAADGQPSEEASTNAAPAQPGVADAMRQKLRSPEGQAVYKMRKAVVEPVFGQIKERRGFRRFLFRGLEKGRGGVANHLPDAQPVEAVPGRSVPASNLQGLKSARRLMFQSARPPKLNSFTDACTLHRQASHGSSDPPRSGLFSPTDS